MKLSMIIFGIALAALGLILTFTVIGAIAGIPLIVIGVIIFILGLILPIRL
jgi:hypothetical protein